MFLLPPLILQLFVCHHSYHFLYILPPPSLSIWLYGPFNHYCRCLTPAITSPLRRDSVMLCASQHALPAHPTPGSHKISLSHVFMETSDNPNLLYCFLSSPETPYNSSPHKTRIKKDKRGAFSSPSPLTLMCVYKSFVRDILHGHFAYER